MISVLFLTVHWLGAKDNMYKDLFDRAYRHNRKISEYSGHALTGEKLIRQFHFITNFSNDIQEKHYTFSHFSKTVRATIHVHTTGNTGNSFFL